MRQAKKKMDKVALSLILCFAVIALTSVFAVKSSLDKINENRGDNIEISKEAKTSDTDKDETSDNTSATGNNIPTVDSRDTQKEEKAQFIKPLNGEIIKKYSMDMVIYSKTLDQYMTHSGIDIAAPLKAEVKAVGEGTVTKIYEDDRYGVTIEINHGDKLISHYSNLSNDVVIELGDVVKQGKTIAYVGETALFENLEESHLHFEMSKDGKVVDPAKYIEALSK